MIEEFARWNIYDKVQKEYPLPMLVSLRGKPRPDKDSDEWRERDSYFSTASRYAVYEHGIASKLVRQPSGSPFRSAVGLFSRSGELICEGYIRDMYDGDWMKAIKELGTFENLMTGFKEYFAKRRTQFMEKTEKAMKQYEAEQGLRPRKSRIPQSHGGVANLLKVLTKTMYEQGSSIRTIAKVQYTICTQAGIFIPDEFITDVLVAAEIDPEIFTKDEKRDKKL